MLNVCLSENTVSKKRWSNGICFCDIYIYIFTQFADIHVSFHEFSRSICFIDTAPLASATGAPAGDGSELWASIFPPNMGSQTQRCR